MYVYSQPLTLIGLLYGRLTCFRDARQLRPESWWKDIIFAYDDYFLIQELLRNTCLLKMVWKKQNVSLLPQWPNTGIGDCLIYCSQGNDVTLNNNLINVFLLSKYSQLELSLHNYLHSFNVLMLLQYERMWSSGTMMHWSQFSFDDQVTCVEYKS